MANTQLENCQRGAITMWFLFGVFVFIFFVIKVVRGNIDLYNQGKQDDYDENKKNNESQEQFDAVAIRNTRLQAQDPILDRIIKRTYEFEVFFLPFFILFVFNLATGTMFAFNVVLFFITFTVALLFNLLKIHWALGVEHKVLRVIIENIWLFLAFFFLVNIWATTTALQPYFILAA